jgi:hypothetical protein
LEANPVRTLLVLAATAVTSVLTAPAAQAQQADAALALRRADAAGMVGWFGNRRVDDDAVDYSEWNNRWTGAFVAGWLWTSHVKTDVELGITSEADSWVTLTGLPGPRGSGGFIYEERYYRDLFLAVGQTWQFNENAWVHPFVTGGLTLNRERTRRERPEQWAGPDQPPLPRERYGSSTRLVPGAFVGAGLKTYVNERVFVRTDGRVELGDDGISRVALRLGLGVDF